MCYNYEAMYLHLNDNYGNCSEYIKRKEYMKDMYPLKKKLYIYILYKQSVFLCI